MNNTSLEPGEHPEIIIKLSSIKGRLYMRQKLMRAFAIAVLGVSLTGGVAAAQTGTISTTGQGSSNKVKSLNKVSNKVKNHVTATVTNSNSQSASSGNANANNNTTGGDVGTGMGMNSSSADISATVDNSSSSGGMTLPDSLFDSSGSIDTTGQGSTNVVSSKNIIHNSVDNNTHLTVTNTNSQTATSGDATANNNTTVGNVTTGDTSNTSDSTITLSVTN